MNSLACRARTASAVTNRALGPVSGPAIGPNLQFTRSSGYDQAEEERLKIEQSATSDLPMHALTVEMREGILAAASATIKSPFGQIPASYFKRTAHALASLEPMGKAEQAVTMGCLPAFASKLSFGCKKSSTPAVSSTAGRQLLPPVKTVVLPSYEDPLELRQIIAETQQKRSQIIQNARITARLQAISVAPLPLSPRDRVSAAAKLTAVVTLSCRNQVKRISHLLGDLIDRLAVA